MSTPTPLSLEQFSELVRRKARRMCGQAGINRSDIPDIEQQLFLKLLKAAPKFDPSLGSAIGFVLMVLDREGANIVRNRQAKRRNPGTIVSLSVLVRLEEGEGVELGQTLDEDDRQRRHGGVARSEQEQAQLAQDVAVALEATPSQLQEFAEAVMATGSAAEAERQLGLTRTGGLAQALRLRSRLGQAELLEYLRG